MSRLTPPAAKVTQAVRRISSSAPTARPSALLDSGSRYLPRSVRDLKSECSKRDLKTSGSKSELVDRLIAYDITRAHSTTNGHRPSPAYAQSIARTRPLMQGFRTSAPVQTAGDTSTIDFFFFPEIPPPPPDNPFQKLRVPLLPDNYSPDRSPNSAHAIESPDEAVPRPEILIVVSHPEDVIPAAMTEVVGNEAHERDIEELTHAFRSQLGDVSEPGALKELWDGLIDDIFGPRRPKTSA